MQEITAEDRPALEAIALGLIDGLNSIGISIGENDGTWISQNDLRTVAVYVLLAEKERGVRRG